MSVILASFVGRWRKERPSQKGRYDGDDEQPDDVEPVAPYRHLAVETGLAAAYARAEGRFWVDASGRRVGIVSEADVDRAEDDIRRVRNSKRYPTAELRIVDAIVASIGEPSMFDDLTIRPNPKSPASRHGECCGGSLTGSGTIS